MIATIVCPQCGHDRRTWSCRICGFQTDDLPIKVVGETRPEELAADLAFPTFIEFLVRRHRGIVCRS